jgi:hypothetical protein
MSNADNPLAEPAAEKPEPKSKKPAEKTGLADAAASSDPYVQKLMWDRGMRDGNDVAAIDDELRSLGFDL